MNVQGWCKETLLEPSRQFSLHQDEFGNVSYGYKNPNSGKDEKRDAYGNVVGAYSYIDATGVPKQLSYVADDYGYRVTATNALPLGPPHPAH